MKNIVISLPNSQGVYALRSRSVRTLRAPSTARILGGDTGNCGRSYLIV
ncbi:MAG: hypothetical protein GDA43_15615 [Hormoscilla sp. SP5CHS1]|nr:hypothetical protein [Hormoscilla sp. SP12CHS1]MBC6454442.1 hypothetical protein [Hormoscilla sp. SP5CHS1]